MKHPPNLPFTLASSYRLGNSTISPWRSRDMMFAASSGETIFVKSFSKVPTFTAHHLWVWFSFAAMNVTVSRWPLKSPAGTSFGMVCDTNTANSACALRWSFSAPQPREKGRRGLYPTEQAQAGQVAPRAMRQSGQKSPRCRREMGLAGWLHSERHGRRCAGGPRHALGISTSSWLAG